MTAPAEQGTEQPTQDRRSTRHKLCASQAVALRHGLPRVALCGHVLRGPRRSPRSDSIPCPICFTEAPEHRATCPACIEAVQ